MLTLKKISIINLSTKGLKNTVEKFENIEPKNEIIKKHLYRRNNNTKGRQDAKVNLNYTL